MAEMYDVAIVGGSIAGAATAWHLARRGRRIVIIERASCVRRKACGEGLFPSGVRELAEIGVLDRIRPLCGELAALRIIAGGERVQAPLGSSARPALGVRRSVLDNALLRNAESAGVEVRRGVVVESLICDGDRYRGVRTDAGDVEARMIVAADGLRSRLRREAGLDAPARDRRYGVSAHLRLRRVPDPAVEVYVERGYELYVTPVGGAVVNAALLLEQLTMRRFSGDLAGKYRATLAAHPAFRGGFDVFDEPAAAGPFPARSTQAWRDNLVLAGDAAGFYDGISGEGMSSALTSARACAGGVDAYLAGAGEPALQRYDARRRALVRNSDMLARISLTLARHPVLARVAVRNLARRPQTFARLLRINTGEADWRALRPPDVLALAAGI